MASYKGVSLLKEINHDFSVWKEDVLGYIRRLNKPAYAAMTKVPTVTMSVTIEDGADSDTADATAGQSPVVHVDVDDADLEAASLIRLFLTVEMKHLVTHLTSGSALWKHL